MTEKKEYGIHDYFISLWKNSPVEILRKHNIKYHTYVFSDENGPAGFLYVYETDPITNLLIFSDIGVTDDCPIAEIEVPR